MTKKGGGVSIFCVLCCLMVSCSPKPPISRAARLNWNVATITNNYELAGHKNPKWDQSALDALRQFARSKTASEDEAQVLSDLIGSSAGNAVSADCDDPMVKYLYVSHGSQVKARTLNERQELYCEAASNLQYSAYSPLWKFDADMDVVQILSLTRNVQVWPQVRQFRSDALRNLNQAFQDKTLPESEACQAADSLFHMLSSSRHELTNAYTMLEATLSTSGSRPAVGALVKAEFYLQYAWIGRGHGTSDQVTDEQWQMFRDRLAEAEKALNQAWAHDPYDAQIPTLMISIATGQEKARPEMEKWFQRALQLDPNNYQACRAKLHYLLPQWYGSREDMLAFGHECVASTNWGGEVPLIVVNAHSEFAHTLSSAPWNEYWALPDVWPDIKAGYEKFGLTEPDATSYRYPYARYAARCGQWKDFNEQIKIIRQNDGSVNESYFGGKEAFQKLLDAANARGAGAGDTNTPSK